MKNLQVKESTFNRIRISDTDIEKFILSFLGNDEEFFLVEPLSKLSDGKLMLVGYLKNLKDNTLEKATIEINLNKLLK